MALTVVTIAAARRLTSLRAIREQLGLSLTSGAGEDDALLEGLNERAAAAIRSYCHREFARQVYTETLPGFGDIHLQLSRTPVIAVSAVSVDGSLVTDYTIANRDRGWLYRRAGWAWSVQTYPGLSGGGHFMDMGSPLPQQEEPNISVDFTGGYILPSQDLLNVGTVSVSAADNSFNDSASKFPPMLKAGDVIENSGFDNAANNGRFEISGTPTAAKIVVTAALVTEAAADGRYVRFKAHKESRPFDDVEQAAIECVKTWFLERGDDSRIIEKQVGPMRARYSEAPGADERLPPACIGLLRPWIRTAAA